MWRTNEKGAKKLRCIHLSIRWVYVRTSFVVCSHLVCHLTPLSHLLFLRCLHSPPSHLLVFTLLHMLSITPPLYLLILDLLSFTLFPNILRLLFTSLSPLSSLAFEKPSAIQQRAIHPITQGRDVIAQSQSGTGKTATFSIGILQSLDTQRRETQALVLSPSRELAAQTSKVGGGREEREKRREGHQRGRGAGDKRGKKEGRERRVWARCIYLL